MTKTTPEDGAIGEPNPAVDDRLRRIVLQPIAMSHWVGRQYCLVDFQTGSFLSCYQHPDRPCGGWCALHSVVTDDKNPHLATVRLLCSLRVIRNVVMAG